MNNDEKLITKLLQLFSIIKYFVFIVKIYKHLKFFVINFAKVKILLIIVQWLNLLSNDSGHQVIDSAPHVNGSDRHTGNKIR